MIEHLFAEFASTALMIVFGVGVHCDETLKGSKYRGSGHMFAITTWSFGISVCLFIFGGVCMNPAMALCQSIVGLVPWSSLVPYVIAEMLGGIAGACMAWFIYADDFKASEFEVDPVAIRNIFSTNPTTESYNLPRNFAIEAFDTFVFLTGILCIAANVGENTMMLGIGTRRATLAPASPIRFSPLPTKPTTTGSTACWSPASPPLWARSQQPCSPRWSWASPSRALSRTIRHRAGKERPQRHPVRCRRSFLIRGPYSPRRRA